MNTQEKIGKAIVALRKLHEISQEHLANETGIGRRYMSDVENGKRNISLDVIERICDYFCVSNSYFMALAEAQEPKFKSLEQLKSWLVDHGHEDTVVFDGPDYLSAIVGVTEDGRVVYDQSLMLMELMRDANKDTTYEDLVDYLSYNTMRSLPYAGEKGPIVVTEMNV